MVLRHLLPALALSGGAAADCWNLQHPSDPRPDTLDPVPPTWRRPAWSHLTSTAPPAATTLAQAAPPRVCSVLHHGAKPDGKTLNTAAIHAALMECDAAGGGTVLLPGHGTYLSGPINMTGNHLTLEIAQGAVLRAATPLTQWPTATTNPDHGLNETGKPTMQPFIYAQNSVGVAVSGAGLIDAAGHGWWVRHCGPKTKRGERPFVIRFDHCTDVAIRDITITNQPFWTVRPIHPHAWSPWCDDLALLLTSVAAAACLFS